MYKFQENIYILICLTDTPNAMFNIFLKKNIQHNNNGGFTLSLVEPPYMIFASDNKELFFERSEERVRLRRHGKKE
jgi:hypothetical protein